jgi:acyl-CoA synthetase (AMP-forming)/AMP-acid ligase II
MGIISFWGRTDDVINVAGHRIGTREVEKTINSHSEIAESERIERENLGVPGCPVKRPSASDSNSGFQCLCHGKRFEYPIGHRRRRKEGVPALLGTAQRHRWLSTLLGQGKKAGAGPAAHDNGKSFVLEGHHVYFVSAHWTILLNCCSKLERKQVPTNRSNLCEKLFGFSSTALGNQARDANLMETGHAENGLAYTVIRNPPNGLATLRGAWPGS